MSWRAIALSLCLCACASPESALREVCAGAEAESAFARRFTDQALPKVWRVIALRDATQAAGLPSCALLDRMTTFTPPPSPAPLTITAAWKPETKGGSSAALKALGGFGLAAPQPTAFESRPHLRVRAPVTPKGYPASWLRRAVKANRKEMLACFTQAERPKASTTIHFEIDLTGGVTAPRLSPPPADATFAACVLERARAWDPQPPVSQPAQVSVPLEFSFVSTPVYPPRGFGDLDLPEGGGFGRPASPPPQ